MGCVSSSPAADLGMALKPILPPGHPILAGLAQALYTEYCRHPSSPAVGAWWDRLDKGPLRAAGVSEDGFESWMENTEECIKQGVTSVDQLKAAWGVQPTASQQPMQMGQPMQMAGAMPVVMSQAVQPMGQPGMATAVAQPMGAPCAPSTLSYAQPGTGQPVVVQGVPTA